jgi:hypothetical protein
VDAGSFRVILDIGVASMREVFENNVGPVTCMVEAFGLGLLAEDRNYVRTKVKVLIAIPCF